MNFIFITYFYTFFSSCLYIIIFFCWKRLLIFLTVALFKKNIFFALYMLREMKRFSSKVFRKLHEHSEITSHFGCLLCVFIQLPLREHTSLVMITPKPTFPTRCSFFRLSNQPKSDQSKRTWAPTLAYYVLNFARALASDGNNVSLSIDKVKKRKKWNSIIIISHSLTERESKWMKGNSQLNASIYVKNHHVHKTQLFIIKLINRFFCFLFLFSLSRRREAGFKKAEETVRKRFLVFVNKTRCFFYWKSS